MGGPASDPKGGKLFRPYTIHRWPLNKPLEISFSCQSTSVRKPSRAARSNPRGRQVATDDGTGWGGPGCEAAAHGGPERKHRRGHAAHPSKAQQRQTPRRPIKIQAMGSSPSPQRVQPERLGRSFRRCPPAGCTCNFWSCLPGASDAVRPVTVPPCPALLLPAHHRPVHPSREDGWNPTCSPTLQDPLPLL